MISSYKSGAVCLLYLLSDCRVKLFLVLVLTHLMNFPICIGRTSLFHILGVLSGIFNFYSNSNIAFGEKNVETLNAASGLGLRCLPMSHKNGP